MNVKYSHFLLSGSALILACSALADSADPYDMPLEDLLKVQVTSVSKKAQSLSDAASAIFVVTQEDIKRTGVTNIPDALRMVPGLDVGRIDSNKWAVSSRGFNGRFANKLLVLIDGRSIYTQAFSGVYWENQDVLLEDVDRIEVIRGPGAALWGANAVNGVINIITRHSSETQGGLVVAGGGSLERDFGAVRYGKRFSKDVTGRLYAKGFNRENLKHTDGSNAQDDWDKAQGGFRIDALLSKQDELRVSGDLYYSNINQDFTLPSPITPSYTRSFQETTNASGGNINGQLEHTFSPTSSYKLQFYYDVYKRNEMYDKEHRQTIDLDFQYHFAANDWNDVVWGGGYRYMDSVNDFSKQDFFSLAVNRRTDNYFNAFAQDELALIGEKLWLTLGMKFEHNDYTGFEFQPSARIMWAPHEQHRLWATVSRSVRTPSVIEAEMNIVSQYLPPDSALNPSPLIAAVNVNGNHNYKAEELIAIELGHRMTFAKAISVDSTAFYNIYQSLRSFELGELGFNGNYLNQTVNLNNKGSGETYGFETSLVWQALDWWRWDVNYSYLKTQLTSNQYYQEAIPPQHKLSLRSELSPWKDVNLDFWLRYIDKNAGFTLLGPVNIDSYVTLDVRLAWKPHAKVELSVTGQNLLDSAHLEAVQETFTRPTEVTRSVYGKIAWYF